MHYQDGIFLFFIVSICCTLAGYPGNAKIDFRLLHVAMHCLHFLLITVNMQ